MEISADIVVVGTGVGGLFSTLWLPEEKHVVLITKSDLESSDSFLAQGGICVLRNEEDYDSFFEDTMRAGHYENRKESVDLMIKNSREIIDDLIRFGVDFEQEDGCLKYTREGAQSCPRILFHKDITGKEITSKLLERVKERKNVTILEYTTMTDIIEEDGRCAGILAENEQGIALHRCGGYDSCKRRDRRYVSAFDQLSTSDRRCDPHCEGTRRPSGTSGLCADPSDYTVLEKAGKTFFDLGICERRRGGAVQQAA